MTTAPLSSFDPRQAAVALAAIAGGATSAAPAKDKATIYLAIGTLRDEERAPDLVTDFDPNKDLINLPQMQGLDNMNPDTRKAGTTEFANTQAESNDFLEDLKAQAMATLQPGERRVLPFYVTVYKKKDDVVAEAPATPRPRRTFL